MNLNEFKDFLSKFDISKEAIDEYTKDKKIIEKNKNLFLMEREFEKNEVANDSLIYIQLKYLSPSMYLLNFIKNNSKNILRVKSEKRALDFTYGKDLFQDLVTKHPKSEFELGKYFLVTFNDDILGYIEVAEKRLNNEFHIGDYLKER